MAGKPIKELEPRNRKIRQYFDELNKIPGRTVAWIVREIAKKPDINIKERQIKRVLGYD